MKHMLVCICFASSIITRAGIDEPIDKKNINSPLEPRPSLELNHNLEKPDASDEDDRETIDHMFNDVDLDSAKTKKACFKCLKCIIS